MEAGSVAARARSSSRMVAGPTTAARAAARGAVRTGRGRREREELGHGAGGGAWLRRGDGPERRGGLGLQRWFDLGRWLGRERGGRVWSGPEELGDALIGLVGVVFGEAGKEVELRRDNRAAVGFELGQRVWHGGVEEARLAHAAFGSGGHAGVSRRLKRRSRLRTQ